LKDRVNKNHPASAKSIPMHISRLSIEQVCSATADLLSPSSGSFNVPEGWPAFQHAIYAAETID
jgi:hypothetical protein